MDHVIVYVLHYFPVSLQTIHRRLLRRYRYRSVTNLPHWLRRSLSYYTSQDIWFTRQRARPWNEAWYTAWDNETKCCHSFTPILSMTEIYYLPIWFQAVKSASPVRSGVMNLPLLVSNVVTSILSSIVVTMLGYYAPFMLLASVITPISYGLLTIFHPYTPHQTRIR